MQRWPTSHITARRQPWAHILNLVALVEWIAQPQGPRKAGFLRSDLVSTLEPAVPPEAEVDSVQIKNDSLWPHLSLWSCTILLWCDFSLSKVVSFLWEMSNIVLCVWPREKRTWETIAFGRSDTAEGKPLSRVTVCGNHHPPSLPLRGAGTWGGDPEAMSLRERAVCFVLSVTLDSWSPYLFRTF